MNFGEEAVRIAQQGLYVFPVWGVTDGHCDCGKTEDKSPGKHPRRGIRWRDKSTRDPQTIEWLWDRGPNANIGIDCGKSGIAVLDADTYKPEGKKSYEEILEQIPPIKTPTVQTGGGGFQHIFACGEREIRNSTGILPGIDVRGIGGYIVVPPSMHISGRRYEWIYDLFYPKQPYPERLAEMLIKPKGAQEKRTRKRFELGTEIIPDGSRNETLLSHAGSLRHIGFPPGVTLTVLKTIRNEHCENPETISDSELERIVQSAWSYSPRIDLYRYAKWWRTLGLTGSEMLVLINIAIDQSSAIPSPSLSRTKKMTGLSESTIYTVRDKLSRKGIIAVTPGHLFPEEKPALIVLSEPPPSVNISTIIKTSIVKNVFQDNCSEMNAPGSPDGKRVAAKARADVIDILPMIDGRRRSRLTENMGSEAILPISSHA